MHAEPLRHALRDLVNATHHMTDTSPLTGDAFPKAHARARHALEVHDAPRPSLDELLDRWQVLPPGMWENDTGPRGWYAVTNDDGIVAYFSVETAALRFRLAEINRALNG